MISIGFVVEGQVLENYNNKLNFDRQSGWFSSSEVIRVNLDTDQFPASSFQFCLPKGATLFVGEVLWFHAEEDTSFIIPLATMKEKFHLESNANFSILKKGIKIEDVVIKKGFFNSSTPQNTLVNIDYAPEEREVNSFYDFFFSALVIILLLVAMYKFIYPLVLSYIVDPQSLFTAEDFSESNALQKFFTLDIIFFILIINLLMALIAMVGIKETGWGSQLSTVVQGSLNELFFYWLVITLALFIGTIFKFLFIKFITFIYDLGKKEFSHFFYLLRIVSILLMVLTLIITIVALNSPESLTSVLQYSFYLVFWAYIIGVFFLMLIMMNKVSFNNYHLFAYICTAELVPFLIISKFIIG
ncbi:DUF4271 domain-containing protein [Belliella sp. DSM 111904]|uniref:DUF4271 domain-containing protein n=1 Tax=Belliella filtrata TaxID=2923435 RepID=A0ABS9UZP8_9BACT|nr:DUF4271 domain-containing protein [Belliella filtrata]MCH7409558.1 DUF4271 domain-containing protein [Belliella filtrata]